MHTGPKFLHGKKINTTSSCVNHVYTHSPKLFSVIKFGSGSIFCVFTSVASILIGNYDEYNFLFFLNAYENFEFCERTFTSGAVAACTYY